MQGAELWTDFAIQADGFSRFVMRDLGMRDLQGGRLVQRVLEIETYRMMALLGLPARAQVAMELDRIEAELAAPGRRHGRHRHGRTRMPAPTASSACWKRSRAGRAHGKAHPRQRLPLLGLEGLFQHRARAHRGAARGAHRGHADGRGIHGPAPGAGDAHLRSDQCAPGRAGPAHRPTPTTCCARGSASCRNMQNRRILESMNARAAQQLRLQLAVEGCRWRRSRITWSGCSAMPARRRRRPGCRQSGHRAGLLVPLVAGAVWLAPDAMVLVGRHRGQVVVDQAEDVARHQRGHALADADVGVQLVHRLGRRFVEQLFDGRRRQSGLMFSATSACASSSWPSSTDSFRLMVRRWWRIAERALPVRTKASQVGLGREFGSVTISTMSPLRSSVRSGPARC
jgi:hypothetical protein